MEIIKEDSMQIPVTDFLVETKNPEMLDDTLQHLPLLTARVLGRGTPGGITVHEGLTVVRVFGDAGFFRFAMEQQGYCKIRKQLDQLL